MHARPTARAGRPRRLGCGCLLLGGFGLIFYQFVPKTETAVGYYPWFYEQVQNDNIKTISIQGTEVRGELRKEQLYQSAPNQQPQPVKRFVTNAPSEAVDRGVRSEADSARREADA